MNQPVFNFACRKVGGIWFVRLGRFRFSFCIARAEPREYPWPQSGDHRRPRQYPCVPGRGKTVVVSHDR